MLNNLIGLISSYRKHKVYSIGYQGRNIEEFLNMLKKNEIKVLIDTRKSGLSRKPYFSRNALKQKVEKRGIKFIGLSEVGAPKEFREYLKETGNLNNFFKMYRKHIVKNNLFDNLGSHINGERTCIMCFERNPYECHRLVLSDMINENMDTEVIHI
ncbi:MAG: DUF488 domain-containing protein [Candidatus Aenigmarchaeota archaeon]|nr:DUF488 domain-containing protein [Candidatus Aenigmarchaeota archaeon]